MIGGVLAGQAIAQAGVKCVFTLCGGHVAPIYIGLQMSGVRIIDTRHEAAAAHAADAWGRLTGVPGCAIVTAGPGVTNAVTGIANAYEAESPMVVIGGKVGMARMDQGSLQEMDQISLVKSITKWQACVYDTARIPEYLARAFHIANTGRRGPVYIEIPIDKLLEQGEPKHAGPSLLAPDQERSAGEPAAVAAAAELLAGAERPVIVGGASLHWDNASASLDRFVRKAGVPTYLNALGRGMLPHDHPMFYSLTRKPALSRADVVLLVGAEADFRLGYGRGINPEATIIQVEPDASKIGFNIAPQHVIIGDAALVLDALADAVDAPNAAREAWSRELRGMEVVAREELMGEMTSDVFPVNPHRFGAEIAKVMDENTIIIGDGGNIVATTSKCVPLNGPRQWMDPGKFGCLGVGMPFALAAQAAFPDKKVLVVFGDGSVGFNGFEYDTAVRHDLPIVGIVGNDAAWTQIRCAQIEAAGEEFAAASLLAPTHYGDFVKSLGGEGYQVESAADIAPTLQKAFAAKKPALINVPLDAKLNGRGVSYVAAGLA
ncbi:acetolactate synthase [bacterium]|nr:acetolactate synthase [bacterium]